jgi:hypothetical protein
MLRQGGLPRCHVITARRSVARLAGPDTLGHVTEDAVGVIDPGNAQVTTIDVGGEPTAAAYGDG